MGDQQSKPAAEATDAAPPPSAPVQPTTADAATQTEPEEQGYSVRDGRAVFGWEDGEGHGSGTPVATCRMMLLVYAYRLKRTWCRM